MTRKLATLAATLILATLLTAAPAAADPEPIPCSPGSCEPLPCDYQEFVNLGQQIIRLESKNARLEDRLERRGEAIVRLRARLHKGWS